MWHLLLLVLIACGCGLNGACAAEPKPSPPPPSLPTAPPAVPFPPAHSAPPLPESATEPSPPPPAVENLGDERYRIGAITVSKAEGFFTLPGTVIRREAPLEFVATAKNGLKSYESLLELDADPIAFNLGCILIGLDSQRAKLPRHHFDPEPTQGDPVEVRVSWETDGKTVSVNAAELFLEAGKSVTSGEWIYTGSGFLPDGRYMAATSGSLISFVHDPESVIQHRLGIGLNNYGGVQINSTLVPPVGTPIRLTIRRLKP